MSAFGVLYGVVVLGYFNHWRRRRFPDRTSECIWLMLNFTPIGWILYPLLKPWREGSLAKFRRPSGREPPNA